MNILILFLFSDLNHSSVLPVVVVVQQDVAVTRLGMATTSQLLDLQLQIETISSQKLAVLLGQLVVGVGGVDLLPLHPVHQLQHLEAHLVHEALGVLGQQHDLLQVQGVAQTSHRFSRLNATVTDAQFPHLLQDGLSLQSVNVSTLLDAELPDAAAGAVRVAVLQLASSCSQLVQPGP